MIVRRALRLRRGRPAHSVQHLRRAGAKIGPGVVIHKTAQIHCPDLLIEEGVVIQAGVVLHADVARIGKLSFLGKNSTIMAKRVTFGENVFINHSVEIGGGGANDPESEIEIGSHCHIGQEVHLNCCRKLSIGEETTVSMRSMIMTHCFANSMLEGFPTVFAPVTIGSQVQLGLQVVIFPGVTIADNVVVGSNSSVVSKIPEGKYAVGVPAVVEGESRKALKPARVQRMARGVVEDFLRQLDLKEGLSVNRSETSTFAVQATIEYPTGQGVLAFTPTLKEEHLQNLPTGEVVIATLHVAEGLSLPSSITVIELLSKKIQGSSGSVGESFREFLRKRGIRLEPRTWCYTGGLL